VSRRRASSPCRFWSRHFLWCELVAVGIVTAAFVVWSLRYGGEQHVLQFMEDRRGAIYGVLAGIFGSLLGFAIAAEAIVLSLSGSDKLSIVRNSKHYPTLWRVFRWTIRTLAVATVAAVLALVLDRDKAPWMLWLYVCAGFALLAAAQLARTIWVLEQVVSTVSAKKGGD
jgi:hypothetical protein